MGPYSEYSSGARVLLMVVQVVISCYFIDSDAGGDDGADKELLMSRVEGTCSIKFLFSCITIHSLIHTYRTYFIYLRGE